MRRLVMLSMLLAGCAAPQASKTALPFAAYEEPSLTCDASERGTISGAVRHENTDVPLGNALVVLQANVLDGERELMTDEYGRYRFEGLPPGTYTVQVLVGQANVNKIVTLPEHASYRANFMVDPDATFARQLDGPIIERDQSLFSVIDDYEARLLNMPKTRYGL